MPRFGIRVLVFVMALVAVYVIFSMEANGVGGSPFSAKGILAFLGLAAWALFGGNFPSRNDALPKQAREDDEQSASHHTVKQGV